MDKEKQKKVIEAIKLLKSEAVYVAENVDIAKLNIPDGVQAKAVTVIIINTSDEYLGG